MGETEHFKLCSLIVVSTKSTTDYPQMGRAQGHMTALNFVKW